jgi:hypothetical protein
VDTEESKEEMSALGGLLLITLTAVIICTIIFVVDKLKMFVETML